MERDAPPELDPRLAHALAHPTRSAILRMLIGTDGLSPRSLAEKLGVTAAKLKYHVDVLRLCGAVEAVKDAGRADEQKAQQRPVADGLRADVSEEQLRNLIEIAGELGTGYDGRGA
jgi:DNA-binding transcriptional ArsR family regulator